MTDRIWIGIDPGLGGALAAIGPNGDLAVSDTPTQAVAKGGKNRREYDDRAMAKLLARITIAGRPHTPVSIVLERSMPRPTDGKAASFGSGIGYGIWRGIAAWLEWPLHLVTPSQWRPKMVGVKQPKAQSIAVAKRLFPQAADRLTLKKHDGRAEALLIAEYGRRKYG